MFYYKIIQYARLIGCGIKVTLIESEKKQKCNNSTNQEEKTEEKINQRQVTTKSQPKCLNLHLSLILVCIVIYTFSTFFCKIVKRFLRRGLRSGLTSQLAAAGRIDYCCIFRFNKIQLPTFIIIFTLTIASYNACVP